MKKRLILLGLLTFLLCALSLIFLDGPTQFLQTAEQADRSYRLVRTLTDAGEGAPFFALAILGSFGSLFLLRSRFEMTGGTRGKIEKLRQWSLSFLYSLLAAGILAQVLKFTFGRQRPHLSAEYDPCQFVPFNFHWHNHSFPSGHSQTLFVVGTALCWLWPRASWWVYGAVTLLALTRIPLHQHFLSDVLLGAYVGHAITLLIFNHRAKTQNL